jgi:hypothetical protein
MILRYVTFLPTYSTDRTEKYISDDDYIQDSDHGTATTPTWHAES